MTHEQPKRKTKIRPDHIDKKIGAKIRELRIENGQTLQSFASYLDLSYQQIQKYEAGQNQIAASTLYLCAAFLGVPIQDLFEDVFPSEDVLELVSTTPGHNYRAFLRNPENVRLMTSFLQIGDLKLRRKFFDVMDELVSLIDTPVQHEELS